MDQAINGGFLTMEPNAEVRAIHPKALPVIPTTPDEVDVWMRAPREEAKTLQRALTDDSCRSLRSG